MAPSHFQIFFLQFAFNLIHVSKSQNFLNDSYSLEKIAEMWTLFQQFLFDYTNTNTNVDKKEKTINTINGRVSLEKIRIS